MCHDSYYLEMLAKQRHQAFEQEAALVRLRRSARKKTPKTRDILSVKLANLLIRTGESLKKRVALKTPCCQLYSGLPEDVG
ncbi:MAG: hypothetical protein GY860_16150 [Desulfobacteraceae bacterium]|nr:hypothetical protein [Desulfobacteraceae bacterium]